MKNLYYLTIPNFIVICFFLLISFTCLSPDCWHDEIVTLGESCGQYGDLIHNLQTLDVYPPLYYSIIYLVACILNIDCVSTHFIFMIPIMKTITFIFTGSFFWIICKYLNAAKGKLAGITCALICISNPVFLDYIVEIRPYTFSAILCATGFLSGLQAMQSSRKSWWILYSLSTADAAYTHYYAMLTMTLLSVFFLAYGCIKERNHILPFLVANAAAVILFLPWVPSLLRQMSKVQDKWWCTEPLSQSFKYVLNICGLSIGDSFIPWFSILLIIGIYALYSAYKSKNFQSLFVVLSGYLIIPVIWFITIANSLLNHQRIVQQRYLFFGIFIFAIGVAWAAAHLPRKWHALFNLFLIIITCGSVYGYLYQEYKSCLQFAKMQTLLSEESPAYVYYTPMCKDLNINKLAVYTLPAKNATPIFAKGTNMKNISIWHFIYNNLYSKLHVDITDLPDSCTVILTESMTPYFLDELKDIHPHYTIQKEGIYNIFKISKFAKKRTTE